ncbi:hypothetical protein JTE90_027238 [Oedothorax gibbosus]|uniref:Uncharacterized protein n=1 Tax=Oedothorax gibbosus TaxID=931172 RepID=A0AAV6U4D9_9ARAC|nr:hypothetical protein JTE90_027238 [Oedothorax gibbosus]
MTSRYCKQLDVPARLRYNEKLYCKGLQLPDPLDIELREHIFSDDTRNWPELEFGDIYMYLVETVCWYTKDQFRSYKLSEGYNVFSSGKVKKIWTYCVLQKTCTMIVAQVEAGQTLKKYYEPWAVLDGTGKILSCHCTCMAG